MNEIGRSTLLMKWGRLVGFGFAKHPTNKKMRLHVVFYWIKPERWVICLAETATPNPALMRPHLGEIVSGAEFAPFAQREISGIQDFDEFRKIIVESFPGTQFEWWKPERK